MEQLFTKGVTAREFSRFVAPSVVMLLFIAFYYVIDSIFVSNFVGSNALAAMSIAYPVQSIVWGVSVMLAAGSSAIVAIKMG
ncbi:MAG: MATE family efflux transporter, partial [Bacillota bacterium]|nr:MATE family efflux transporter [Bacillota bacterium]